MITLGQLTEIKDLRKVWPHEALDFTPWLAEEENIKLLGDAVGLEITVDETESSVGDFNFNALNHYDSRALFVLMNISGGTDCENYRHNKHRQTIW